MTKRLPASMRIALTYFIVGMAWILLSNSFTEKLASNHLSFLEKAEYFKGALFIGASSLFLYITARQFTFKIEKSNTKIRHIFNRISDGFIALDSNYHLIYANKHAAELFGQEGESLVGKHFWTEFPDLTGTQLHDFFQKAMQEKKHIALEYYFERQRQWLEFALYPSIYPQSEGISVYFRNITERKESELSLQESAEKFRTLFEEAADGIVVFSLADQGILQSNKKTSEILGYSAIELASMKICDLLATSHCCLIDEKGRNIPNQTELLLQRKDGSELFAEASTRALPDGTCLTFIRDITSRKKAEEEILKSQERFKLAAMATKDCIWDLDLEKEVVWYNDLFHEIFNHGRGGNEFRNESRAWLAKVHPEDCERLKACFDNALTNGSDGWQEEFRFLLADGSYGTFLDRAFVVRDKAGKPVRILGAIMDLTDIKKTEQKLKESEEKFAKAFYNNNIPLVITDEEGYYQDFNAAVEKAFGYSRQELIGKSSVDLGIFKPEYRAEILKELENVAPYANKEFQARTKAGNIISIDVSLTKLEIQGKSRRLYTFIDITEKKKAEEELRQSEEQYRLLFNATPIPAWVIHNEQHHYLAVNDAAINHYGYSREEFLALHTKDIRPENEQEIYLDAMKNKTLPFNGNQNIWKHRKKDGTLIDVDITALEITYKNNPARLVLGYDVTEKLRMEREMVQANEELRTLSTHLQHVREEERNNIAREIHDELGQQLTGLRMDAHWLNKKLHGAEPLIKGKLSDMLTLIDDTVKSVRRISTHLRPSILDDLGLEAALDWLSNEMQHRSEMRIVFKSEIIKAQIPTQISTGLFRIYQETLTNSVRHAHASEIKSHLYLENEHIILEVCDNGKGIAPEDRKKKTFGLLGIKERTYAMEGSFHLASEQGKGTHIRISIPIPN